MRNMLQINRVPQGIIHHPTQGVFGQRSGTDAIEPVNSEEVAGCIQLLHRGRLAEINPVTVKPLGSEGSPKQALW